MTAAATDTQVAIPAGAGDCQGEAVALAAAVDLLVRVANSADLQQAGWVVAKELRAFFGAQRVVIGWRDREHGPCQIIADTATAIGDDTTAAQRRLHAALDELAIVGSTIKLARSSDNACPPGTLAVQQYFDSQAASDCIGGALFDAQDRVCGAWLFVDAKGDVDGLPSDRLIDTLAKPLGAGLASVYQHQPGRMQKSVHAAAQFIGRQPARWIVAGLILLGIAVVFPIQYQVRCDCKLWPVSRRMVVAPLDGSLEKSEVRPGDLVRQGEVLARLSARELDWELTGLRADLNRANKQRKVSLAKQDYADSQIAELESEQLKQRVALLESRLQSLEVRSPIDGIVVAGDMHEVEGSPLERGQALLEIAPLGRMRAELMIDQIDYVYVRAGMPVRLRLEAFPTDVVSGLVDKVYPAAEVIENRNVFVAEVNIDDPHGIYRSGMHGKAKIASDTRPAAWVLLHKPWSKLSMWLGW